MKKIYYKPNLDIISFNSQDTTSVTNISAVTNRMTKAKTELSLCISQCPLSKFV